MADTKATSKLGGGAIKCGVCEKTVYAQEKIDTGKLAFHKRCFRCSKCDMSLTPQNYGQDHGILYCQNDFKKYVVAQNTQAPVL